MEGRLDRLLAWSYHRAWDRAAFSFEYRLRWWNVALIVAGLIFTFLAVVFL